MRDVGYANVSDWGYVVCRPCREFVIDRSTLVKRIIGENRWDEFYMTFLAQRRMKTI